jgi:hypothetical protein
MDSIIRRVLDPLDLEILERALDAVCVAIKESDSAHLECDETLEAGLRRELIELVRLRGVSDPETLRDIVLAGLNERCFDPSSC